MQLLIDQETREDYQDLLTDMFGLRKRIFCDRLGWPLAVKNGLEIDEFDTDAARYQLIIDQKGRLAGSQRLLPTRQNGRDDTSLLFTKFRHVITEPVGPSEDMWEASRGCVHEAVSGPAKHWVMGAIAVGQLEAALLAPAPVNWIACLVNVSQFSLFAQIGWDMEVIGEPTADGIMALRIRVSHTALDLARRTTGIGDWISRYPDPATPAKPIAA